MLDSVQEIYYISIHYDYKESIYMIIANNYVTIYVYIILLSYDWSYLRYHEHSLLVYH